MKKVKYGFTCGAFDLLHYGHVIMFKECKKYCEHLTVGLQVDPSVDRKDKHKPLQSLKERLVVLDAIKYIDKIITYKTEKDLLGLLKELKSSKELDIRFLGDDWKGKEYTGWYLPIKCHFNKRMNHKWSSSYMRELVKNETKCKL